jgi:curved DNA-binding protein CbpA
VTDFFALLALPRRPWLDPEEVNARFVALSAEAHPDRVFHAPAEQKIAANQQFAELNAACRCLRDPKERLRHLLELERGAKLQNLERLPSAAVDFYYELGQALKQADAFLEQRGEIVSPLAKVQRFEAAMGWRDRLEQLQSRLGARRGELEAEIRALNEPWDAAPPNGSAARVGLLPLDRLENIYRDFSYVVRWSGQIRDRIVQLSV